MPLVPGGLRHLQVQYGPTQVFAAVRCLGLFLEEAHEAAFWNEVKGPPTIDLKGAIFG